MIEGSINLASGKFAAGATPEPEMEIILPKGVYKFRVYFGAVKGETQPCRLYFWPSEEKESNKIAIIKQDQSGF